MKANIKYQQFWLGTAKRALEDAKVYHDAGLNDQSLNASEIGHYCMKRYHKAHLKFISAQRERTQQTAGTVIFIILLTAIVHYFLTHSL